MSNTKQQTSSQYGKILKMKQIKTNHRCTRSDMFSFNKYVFLFISSRLIMIDNTTSFHSYYYIRLNDKYQK